MGLLSVVLVTARWQLVTVTVIATHTRRKITTVLVSCHLWAYCCSFRRQRCCLPHVLGWVPVPWKRLLTVKQCFFFFVVLFLLLLIFLLHITLHVNACEAGREFLLVVCWLAGWLLLRQHLRIKAVRLLINQNGYTLFIPLRISLLIFTTNITTFLHIGLLIAIKRCALLVRMHTVLLKIDWFHNYRCKPISGKYQNKNVCVKLWHQ